MHFIFFQACWLASCLVRLMHFRSLVRYCCAERTVTKHHPAHFDGATAMLCKHATHLQRLMMIKTNKRQEQNHPCKVLTKPALPPVSKSVRFYPAVGTGGVRRVYRVKIGTSCFTVPWLRTRLLASFAWLFFFWLSPLTTLPRFCYAILPSLHSLRAFFIRG